MHLPISELDSRFKNAKILIAEGDEFIRIMLSSVLNANGFSSVVFAINGYEALEKVNSEKPDMVIIGNMIAEMNGFEFCSRLRADPQYSDLPVLMQTALTHTEERLAAFEVGATDLINKPINPREFIARIKLHLDNRFLIRNMEQQHEKVELEMKQARQMQNMLLPKRESIAHIASKYNLTVSSYFETCDIMGGDFWGVEPLDEKRAAFYIVDCTGHGVTAAMNTFRMHALIRDMVSMAKNISPALYLSTLNLKLCGLLPTGQFATMFYGIIDIGTAEITYSCAASTAPVIMRGDDIEFLKNSGFPLGIETKAVFENFTTSFRQGDKILLYSDALIENIDSNGNMFGEERLLKIVRDNKKLVCTDLIDMLIKDFMTYGNNKLADDLTINIYSRL